MKDILKKALHEIKPTKEEEKKVFDRVNIIIKKINKKITHTNAILGGSGAKGTWLKTFDADIFVKFSCKHYHDKSEHLSDILGKTLKKLFPTVKRLHGSRDYFQIRQAGYTFEIVPILDIKKAEQAKNITDVSPLHAQWVKKHKRLADEIRLTKQFFKAQNAYGAESHIKGFSGYVCEILTIYYGSFKDLIKNASKWKEKVIIDINNYHKGKNIMMELNKSKLHSPMVIIDPVQSDRNAAAALSFGKFDIIRKSSKQFLSKPSIDFFRKKEFSIEGLKAKNKDKKIIIIKTAVKDGKRDVIGSKILKAFDHIRKKLVNNDFKLYNSGWEWDEKNPAVLYFVADKEELSKEKIRKGPILKAKWFVKDFKKKHKKTFIKGNRIYAYVKRDIRNAEDFAKCIKKDAYIKDKVKKFDCKIFN